jgi:hypothetical protein
VWKEFPFDSPDLNLRIEMTSVTIKEFAPFIGWKVRYNVHEYYGGAVQAETLSSMLRILRPVLRQGKYRLVCRECVGRV